MKTFVLILNDFFKTALMTWLVLVLFELFNAGMVQRFINLEYWFYGLIVVYIIHKFLDK